MDQESLVTTLQTNGLISESVARMVIDLHKKSGKPTGKILFEKKFIDEKRLYRFLIDRYHINPDTYAAGKNYEFAGLTLPKYHVSGDFYGFFPLAEGRVAITLSDVSGKGLEAGILALALSDLLQHSIHMGSIIPSMIMRKINEISMQFFSSDQFATFIIMILDMHSSTIEVCGAGSPPILVFRRKSGRIDEIHPKGIPIGIIPDYIYTGSRFDLEKGDTILLYSDGAYESQNLRGDFYGVERVKELLAKNAQKAPSKLIRTLIRQLKWFTLFKSLNDDTTYISIQRLRSKRR
jgi:sigma-B regulation protein RsbU (phosphoserine phosphatase)